MDVSEAGRRTLVDDVFDGSVVGICVLDAHFHLAWMNRAAESFFGLRREDVVSGDQRRLVREHFAALFDDGERVAQRLLAAYDDNTRQQSFDVHVKPGAGREARWLRHHGQPIRAGTFAGGRLEHWYDLTVDRLAAVARDGTEVRQDEKSRCRREAQLVEAEAIAHLGSWEWEVGSGQVTWSDELYDIYGVTRDSYQATFKSYLARVHPDDRERVRRIVVEALRTGRPFEFDERIVRPGGEVRVLHSRGRVEADARGRPTRMVGACHDVTEFRAAERALRENHALLSALHALDQAILEARSAEEVAGVALDRLRLVLPYQRASVVLFDARGAGVVAAVVADEASDPKPGTALPLDHYGPTQAALRAGRVGVVDDLATVEPCNEVFRRLLAQGLRSCVNVPLVARGELVGVLNVGRCKPGAFDHAAVDVALEFAGGLAIAIQHSRLREAERRRRVEAETLREANAELGRSLELPVVLDKLLEHLARLVPCDSVNVMLREGGTQVAVHAVRGYECWTDPEMTRRIVFDARDTPGIHAVLIEGRPLLVPDTREYPGWRRPAGAEHVVSWLGVPLSAGGDVIGLYSLDKTEPGSFTEEHLRLAGALAGPAAVAIQNARLVAGLGEANLALRRHAEELAAQRDMLRVLSQRVIDAQESERRRVARELHDEVGQTLTAVKLQLELLERRGAAAAAPQVERCVAVVAQAIGRVRAIALDLRPSLLDDLGLFHAVRWCAEKHARLAGLEAEVVGRPLEPRAAPRVEIACLRIVQEALTNVVRHAAARRVRVVLAAGRDSVELRVEDDGRGFDVEALRRRGTAERLGLLGMEERAQLVGGSLDVESRLGHGTTVRASLPRD